MNKIKLELEELEELELPEAEPMEAAYATPEDLYPAPEDLYPTEENEDEDILTFEKKDI